MGEVSSLMISVILCTRNRSTQLLGTLASLERQDFQHPWELIVVDNGSTDDTDQVIQNFMAKTRISIRAVFEPAAGLSKARNRGITHGKGAFLAFTDDDCYPDPGWLSMIYKCFLQEDVDYCGGRLLLYDPLDRRVSIQESEDKQKIPAGQFVGAGLILGANMAFKREAIVGLRGFDERLGAGTRFCSGEDTDMFRRMSIAGFDGIYEPGLVVYHHHQRRTDEAEKRLRSGHSLGRGACMMKYCLYAPARSMYLRHWYWSLRRAGFKEGFSEVFSGVRFAFSYGLRPDAVWRHPSSIDPVIK
ncbi:glycosyltransferase family 2 protein [Ectothiorhodospira shaposhnikovii]|uniref:glycosyltransferase family 2 protein n=1 Tax=Ectothiorhodospira shaposhnikovii TaxID=1054 RepID=UPI001EE7E07B|nr:glycosyltransferase family A protein [Ectothiorhodospira shaposhnikovii]MCG5512082.1 glycosyltransferase family 2 protein [Ectothiorhodospira shaposhnikovii]